MGAETLHDRQESHIFKAVGDCIAGKVPAYFDSYFNLKQRDIHDHRTRNKDKLYLKEEMK